MADNVKDHDKKVRYVGIRQASFSKIKIQAKAYNDIEIDFWSNSWENAANRIEQGYKVVNVDSFHLYGNLGATNEMLSMWSMCSITGIRQ